MPRLIVPEDTDSLLLLRFATDPRNTGLLLLSVLDTSTTPALGLLTCSAEGKILYSPEDSRCPAYVRVLLSTDWDMADVQMFGRYGIIEVVHSAPQSGETKERRLYICGGTAGEIDGDPQNFIRLSRSDHRSLVTLLRSEKEIVVECVARELDLPARISETAPARFSGGAIQARLAYWATAISAAASPFLIPNVVEAQCASPASGSYDSGTNYSGVDFNHIINSDEGGSATTGYVPGSSSGVTIAGGLDLGVNDASDLAADGVPQNLIDQFQPFLAPGPGQSLVGSAAQNALNQDPTAAQISVDQANQINQAVYNTYSTQVATAFNNLSPNMMFSDLNVQWQTAIVSMYFNSKKIVNTQFFSQVAQGQWNAAIQNLQNFGSPSVAQNNRARRVADYLTNSGCTNGTTNGG